MAPALQISIPSTTTITPKPPSSEKPYTAYNINLILPLGTHTLQKRYTDFTTLHTTLSSSTSSAPPVPLPPKSWLRSTVSSSSLTDTRRRGLEAYLRGILDASDPKWRSSPAFRTFLDLPRGMTDGASSTGDGAAAQDTLDPAAWLAAHRGVKSDIHAARAALRRREDGAGTLAEQHAAASEAGSALVRAAAGIARCEGALKTGAGGGGGDGWVGKGAGLGDGEVRRRRDMLAASRKEVEALQAQMRAYSAASAAQKVGGPAGGDVASKADKAALLGGGKAKGRVLGGPAKETERTRELDNDGVLQLQKQVMAEQEQDVLELGKAVSRMKEMGIMINEELVVQNQMLGLVEQDVDRLQGKLDVGKKRIAKIR